MSPAHFHVIGLIMHHVKIFFASVGGGYGGDEGGWRGGGDGEERE